MRRLCLLVVLLLPTAQAMEMAVEGPGTQLRPEEVSPLVARVTLDCATVLAQPELTPQLRFTTPEAGVEGLVVTGPSTVAIDREDCAGKRELVLAVDFNATGSMAVPAEVPWAVDFTASLGERSSTAGVELEMAYVGRFNATVHAPHRQAGPQKEISYDILIENLGNGRTVFSFSSVAPDRGQVVVPGPIILDAPGQGTWEGYATVNYNTPYKNGPNRANEELRIEVQAASAERSTPGDNATLDLRAETRGLYVPAAGAWLPVGLLGFALLRRR